MNDRSFKHRSRSPLKAAQARLPGQSLDEERERLLGDVLMPHFLLVAIFWSLALMEGLHKWLHVPPYPTAFVVFAAVMTMIAVVRLYLLRSRLRSIRLGRDGEREVGQKLEELRAGGARVFHDVPADGFNLDHVLVMPQGVYVIETKTWSRRGKNPKISVRAGRLYKDGASSVDDPIEQAVAEANWLRQLLKETTGQHIPVWPVVLIPGWYVEPMDAETKAQAWVLNPKAIGAFLAQEREKLDESTVALVCSRISLHVGSRSIA